MNASVKTPYSLSLIIAIMGFGAVGLLAFALSGGSLIVWPELLTGDPIQGSVLAVTHLVTLGWLTSFIFAGAYLMGPVLGEAPLWSRTLPLVHLVFHVAGLIVLIWGLMLSRYEIALTGGVVLVIGLTMAVANFLITGSKKSVWTPANLAFHTALFWLAATGFVAIVILYGRIRGTPPYPAEMMIGLHAHFALFGFLSQMLLGNALRLVPEMLKVKKVSSTINFMAWVGWLGLNGGLMLLAPVVMRQSGIGVLIAGGLIGIGIVGYLLACFTVAWMRWRYGIWPVWLLCTALLVLAVLAGIALWKLPTLQTIELEAMRNWVRTYVSLTLLGVFPFAIIGAGSYFIPRLVWRLRYADWTNHAVVPPVETLTHYAALAPAYFSLLMSFIYLAMGQKMAAPEPIQIGAVLLVVSLFWYVGALIPALTRLLIGVRPEDLKEIPTR